VSCAAAEESSPSPRAVAPHQAEKDRLSRAVVGMSSSTAAIGDPELAKKICVPCNSKDIHAMPEDSAKKMLEQVLFLYDFVVKSLIKVIGTSSTDS
jgi:hypothetical protein